MPNVAGREFPYTPQGMASADRYRQSLGMRHGGPMGFRPVGYAHGDLVEDGGNLGRLSGAEADGLSEPFSYDSESRAAIIEKIMSLTGMQDPLVLLELSDEQLRAALAKVEKEALTREMLPPQGMPRPLDRDIDMLMPPQPMPPPLTQPQMPPQMPPQPMPLMPPQGIPRPSDRGPAGIYRESGRFEDIPGVDRETGDYYPPSERRHGGVMSIRRR